MKFMKKIYLLVLGVLVVSTVYAQEGPGFQETDVEKSSQTNFKFLSLTVDPRASALGGAATANDINNSNAMFMNPATMAYQTATATVGVMQTQWISDINYNAASISFRPEANIGVFGISIVSVDYGEFIGTVRDTNPSGYLDTGTFSPSALAVGLGYARPLTDRFAIGANVKYAYQDLTSAAVDFNDSGDGYINRDYNQGTIAFDFGMLYNTGFESMTFAMSVRNFSQELKYEQENYELPLTFRIGIAMDLIDFTSLDPSQHSFRLAIDANRPRDFSEQIMIGGEYTIMNTVALRAGYTFPTDLEGVNLGVGLQQNLGGFGFAFNYGYTAFDVFDAVHRLGVSIAL